MRGELSIKNVQYTSIVMAQGNTYTLALTNENPKAVLVDVEYYNNTQPYTELYSINDGSNFSLEYGTINIGTNYYGISYDKVNNSVSINCHIYGTNTYKICVIY